MTLPLFVDFERPLRYWVDLLNTITIQPNTLTLKGNNTMTTFTTITSYRKATADDLKCGLVLHPAEYDCSFDSITLGSRLTYGARVYWTFSGTTRNGYDGPMRIDEAAILRGRYVIEVTAADVARANLLRAEAELERARQALVVATSRPLYDAWREDKNYAVGVTIVAEKKYSSSGITYTFLLHKVAPNSWVTSSRNFKGGIGRFDEVFTDLNKDAFSVKVVKVAGVPNRGMLARKLPWG